MAPRRCKPIRWDFLQVELQFQADSFPLLLHDPQGSGLACHLLHHLKREIQTENEAFRPK